MKRMKWGLVVLFSLSFILLTGCEESTDSEKSNDKVFELKRENTVFSENEIYVSYDKEQKVTYLVYDGFEKGGMTVRLDKEGNVYQTTGEESDRFVLISRSKLKGQSEIIVVRDEDTGVEYLIYDGMNRAEIRPRLDTEGKPVVASYKNN